METPIDGFGNPRIHLSLLRLICTNGLVGHSAAFRTEIRAGKQPIYAIRRALESFDNGEGYGAMRQRMESAQTSWASLREVQQLYRVLLRDQVRTKVDSQVLERFHQVTGRPHEVYGLTILDALSVKRQRVLPCQCRVFDLLNFASELATHHTPAGGSQALQAYIGDVISDEYDMEGTAETMKEFGDFFLDHAAARGAISQN